MMSTTSASPHAPNFLVIGPAKTGTTSVYFYLRQHPQVFMSPAKELNFFEFSGKQPQWNGPQMPAVPRLDELPFRGHLIDSRTESNVWWGATATTWEEYLQFFIGATTETAIGEATSSNFFSPAACKNIRRLLPDVRLICILRQPVDRGFSQFLNTRRIGLEPVDDFVAAFWDCERRRQANWWPFLSEYETRGYYVKSLKTYFSHFCREQVRVYLYDDLCSNPVAMIQDIYQFLGVDPSFVPDVSQQYNRSLLPRSRQVSRVMRRNTLIKQMIKSVLPIQLRQVLPKLNQSRPNLHPATRRQLSAGYADEIGELQELIGRDLSSWLRE
ncbi:MAG: sulfotransferase [Chloroflexi bacterium]|nr:sulfotransferase [Chloroflexota bacterium]